MSLRDRLKPTTQASLRRDPYSRFGVLANPFPPASQTAGHPHSPSPADGEIENRIANFIKEHRSQVVVIEGTQGVGKTNLLNHWEIEIKDALGEIDGYYVIRYLADPEASFDSTLRRLFQELGVDFIEKLGTALAANKDAIDEARNPEMRTAMRRLADKPGDRARAMLFRDWLLGIRVLKSHREELDIQFRLDTVESKTGALRDVVIVSSRVKLLEGIFLLLDELEKQSGVLGATAVVRYLSALRAIIDALPQHLFMMLAVTPDAMIRYSAALPAFRSRLLNPILLQPLDGEDKALELARFYVDHARQQAEKSLGGTDAVIEELLSDSDITAVFQQLRRTGERRADVGVRQREFLHALHDKVEAVIADDLNGRRSPN
jgi:hypothetical protein